MVLYKFYYGEKVIVTVQTIFMLDFVVTNMLHHQKIMQSFGGWGV